MCSILICGIYVQHKFKFDKLTYKAKNYIVINTFEL